MPTGSDNLPDLKFNPTAGIPKTSYNEKKGIGERWENITWFSTIQPPIDLVNKKEKQMTENAEATPGFEIKETVVQTGYVDKDGKFVPSEQPAGYVQTAEDVQ